MVSGWVVSLLKLTGLVLSDGLIAVVGIGKGGGIVFGGKVFLDQLCALDGFEDRRVVIYDWNGPWLVGFKFGKCLMGAVDVAD